ncbi:MAG: thermonuclease family protein [Methylomonas sp.]|nr:thermonuclease family protein [Methylomonas sp.]
MKKYAWFSVLCLLIVCTNTVLAESLSGKVVKIADGDTLTMLVAGNRQIKIRLAEIDTPESHQPYGQKAKQALAGLVFSRTITADVQTTDRYGRSVARVYAGTLDVNAELVRSGSAWVYRKYAKDRSLYELEAQAREDKKGLWALPESERTPPWEWRKRK